jgi:hypothetical protein
MDTKYKCGKNDNEYTGKEIYLAVQRGVNLQKIKETRGSKFNHHLVTRTNTFADSSPTEPKYPHSYPFNESKRVKLEFLAECPPRMGDKHQEFPIIHDGPYDGGPNNEKYGDERVVYYWDQANVAYDGNPIVYYCGMITHEGAAPGGFLKC